MPLLLFLTFPGRNVDIAALHLSQGTRAEQNGRSLGPNLSEPQTSFRPPSPNVILENSKLLSHWSPCICDVSPLTGYVQVPFSMKHRPICFCCTLSDWEIKRLNLCTKGSQSHSSSGHRCSIDLWCGKYLWGIEARASPGTEGISVCSTHLGSSGHFTSALARLNQETHHTVKGSRSLGCHENQVCQCDVPVYWKSR